MIRKFSVFSDSVFSNGTFSGGAASVLNTENRTLKTLL